MDSHSAVSPSGTAPVCWKPIAGMLFGPVMLGKHSSCSLASASEPPPCVFWWGSGHKNREFDAILCKTSKYRCHKFSAGCICSDFRGRIELRFSFNLIRNISLFVLMALPMLLHSSHLGVSGCTDIVLAVGLPLSVWSFYVCRRLMLEHFFIEKHALYTKLYVYAHFYRIYGI